MTVFKRNDNGKLKTQIGKDNKEYLIPEEDFTVDILEPIEIYGLEEDTEFITSIYGGGYNYGDEYSDDYGDDNFDSIEIFDEIY